MKKITLFCAFICTMLIAFSQPTVSNTEVYRIINANRDVNKSAGVTNPDRIYPGQTLHYVFSDGKDTSLLVKAGNTQWEVVTTILSMEKIHGQVVPDKKPSEATNPSILNNASMPWWGWLLISCIAVAFILAMVSGAKKDMADIKAKRNPITSGEPMRPGGVDDASALAYAHEVATRQFNTPNVRVTNVEMGFMNGTNVAVFYRNEATPQRKTFTNVPAYRGLLTVNGSEQFVYFLQGCGNDVRLGNYFAGENITFVADSVQSEALRNANRPAQQEIAPAQTTNTELNMVALVTQLVEPMKEKKNGKLIVTLKDGTKIEMMFSETFLVESHNHVREHADSSRH